MRSQCSYERESDKRTEPWGILTLRSREEEEPAKDWEEPSSELEEKSGDWCAGSQVMKVFKKEYLMVWNFACIPGKKL